MLSGKKCIKARHIQTSPLAGIEILDAKKRLGDPNAFKQVVFEDVGLAGPCGDRFKICPPFPFRSFSP